MVIFDDPYQTETYIPNISAETCFNKLRWNLFFTKYLFTINVALVSCILWNNSGDYQFV